VIKRITVLASVLLLSGCGVINQFFNAKQQSAPVKNVPIQQTYYTVQTGDTLYELSRRFNVTERTLILWNHLKSPFVLNPGKTLRVGPLPGEKISRDGYVYTYQTGNTMYTKEAAGARGFSDQAKISAYIERENNLPMVDPNAAPVVGQAVPIAVPDKEVDLHDLAQQGDSAAPVHRIQKSTTGYYTVQSGDSLLEIAQANEVSFSDLQAWNDIKEPSVLYVGKRLRVRAPIKETKGLSVAAPTPATPKPVNLKQENSALTKATPEIQKNTTKAVSVANRSDTNVTEKASITDKTIPLGQTVGGISWKWPLKISAHFGKEGADDEDELEVPVNTPVYAAANGDVLYAGVGMGGYGKMVIINHTDGYISAYNNLLDISVDESQGVSQGQAIGVVGKFNGKSVLGFEIRQEGKVQKLSDFYTF
jgi:lipoprotein NlpD